jgi:proteasome assembly chaperone (PAC2) family protein
VIWEARPALRNPVLVAAFHGWNDGGSAATLAASFLRNATDARRFAVIEPEEYVDFQQIRPRVSLVDGLTREIDWPDTEFFHGQLPGLERDVVIAIGVEPNLRWRHFTAEIAELCSTLGVELAASLGGLLADTPHTRPVPVTGAAHDAELAERLGLRRSRYEGPTGIVGVLHDALGRVGVPSVSLWAAVPHYISANANPGAALALVRHLERLLDVRFDATELESASEVFDRQIAEVVDSDEETAAYVRELESREWDELDETDDGPVPTGDELAEELQRFLRDRRERGEGR